MTRNLAILAILGLAGGEVGAHAGDDARDTIDKALSQTILGHRQTVAEVQDFCAIRVPKVPRVDTPEQWRKQVEHYRNDVYSKVTFRGEAAAWHSLPTNVVGLEMIDGGPGYRIKKLRYEAVPGVWVPALLYEPDAIQGRVPVVLNVNGHDSNGKAADYKQIRCINQAKRGMLALNVEWFGMGQLKGDGYRHGLINAIDLCGTSGIAVHLLMLQRGIDVLLSHPNADPERVAVTGLSGGGWQTSFVSGLDPRVTLADPVAGYSSFATRVRYFEDLGDSEQTPCDLGLVVDYTHLTAMRAPKPTLLTFNAKDNCCFAADHAMPPLVEAATPLFTLFGAEANLRTHVNHDPGDHNYGLDNRLAFYRMVGDHFYAGSTTYPRDEIACDGELKTAEQLQVELPSDNLDFARLASRLAEPLPRNADIPKEKAALERWRADARLRLRGTVRPFDPHTTATKLDTTEKDGLTITRWQLRVGAAWTVPAVEFARGNPEQTTIVLCDEGRAKAGATVEKLLSEGRRVVSIDPFYFGESKINEHDYLFALLVAALGERPLGVQSGQVMAAARWLKARDDTPTIRLRALGPRTSVIARVAAALAPEAIDGVTLEKPLESLKSLVEGHVDYPESPELFCFGLLEAFDIPQLEALSSK